MALTLGSMSPGGVRHPGTIAAAVTMLDGISGVSAMPSVAGAGGDEPPNPRKDVDPLPTIGPTDESIVFLNKQVKEAPDRLNAKRAMIELFRKMDAPTRLASLRAFREANRGDWELQEGLIRVALRLQIPLRGSDADVDEAEWNARLSKQWLTILDREKHPDLAQPLDDDGLPVIDFDYIGDPPEKPEDR